MGLKYQSNTVFMGSFGLAELRESVVSDHDFI